jgi:hypothetical protein
MIAPAWRELAENSKYAVAEQPTHRKNGLTSQPQRVQEAFLSIPGSAPFSPGTATGKQT